MVSFTRRAARRVARLLIALAGVATLVFALVVLIPGMLGLERYVITGGSMAGSIERGDLVVAEPRPVSDLVVGDVITYLPPADSGITQLVTHRIIAVEPSPDGPLFRTQGDANASADPWQFMLAGETQAVVVTTVPALGWVFIALADPAHRMVLLGVPAAVIALMSLREIVLLLRPRSIVPSNVEQLSELTESAVSSAVSSAPRRTHNPLLGRVIVDQP